MDGLEDRRKIIMAQPFFRGNYGSALARVDTRPIMEAGRAQGQMFAQAGAQIGGIIKEYGLNKQKRAKLTGEIEAYYEQNPEALSQIGMSGDEVRDKKDFTEREKFVKGDMSMAQLEGYAGKLARGEVLRSKKLQDDSRRIANQTGEFALGLQKELKDSRVAQAKLTNDLRRLALTEGKAVSPAKIRDILDRYGADAATRPSEVDAKIAQAEDITRKGQAGAAKQDLLDGPIGVAAQELTKEGLENEQMKANIDRTRGLTDALGTQMDLMRNPVDTRTPRDTGIDKQVTNIRSSISSLRKQKSFTKNEEGEFFSLDELIEFDPVTGKATVSEDASKRDTVALDELKKLVEEEYRVLMNQVIKHVFKNGQEVIAPRKDILKLKKKEKDDERLREIDEENKLNARRKNLMPTMDYNYNDLDSESANLMTGR